SYVLLAKADLTVFRRGRQFAGFPAPAPDFAEREAEFAPRGSDPLHDTELGHVHDSHRRQANHGR
ncbi:MAG: hypothetical protein U5M50_16055, partial [Sphingobium sp.]|nr:hypothetical protein [Sphingobium sp.]